MQYVAYYRVSTKGQGRSQLGLQAQQQAVQSFVQGEPIVAEFTEVESGKLNHRPQLKAALDFAELTGSTLVVAKLDRLSRNAAFLNQLFDATVSIKCADMPFADRFTIGILAQVAQWEREQISTRTKEALSAAKRRGRKLGGHRPNVPQMSAAGLQRSIATRQVRASERAAKVAPHISAAQAAGHTSLRSIADYLNQLGVKTTRGCKWEASSVARVIQK